MNLREWRAKNLARSLRGRLVPQMNPRRLLQPPPEETPHVAIPPR